MTVRRLIALQALPRIPGAVRTRSFLWRTCCAIGLQRRIAGNEDVNDAARLSQDPTLRWIGSEKTRDRGAALTSCLQTFETEMLADEENFGSVARVNRELIAKADALDSPQRGAEDGS